MRGGTTSFPWVAKLHLAAARPGVVIAVSWQPRTSPVMRIADAYSKYQDPTDWRLSWTFVGQQIARHAHSVVRGAHTWPPAIGLFASVAAKRQCCAAYYSEIYDRRCLAADAFLQGWAPVPSTYPPVWAARRPLLFAFPPVKTLQQVLSKIAADKANVWLVCPQSYTLPVHVLHALQCLPRAAQWDLNRGRDPHVMVTPSKRVPPVARRQRWCTPLQVVLVWWGEQQ